jgi:hypothetical protein
MKVQNATDGKILTEDPFNWSTLHKNALKHCTFADKVETILFEFADCELHEATPTQLLEAIMYTAEAPSLNQKNAQPTGLTPAKQLFDTFMMLTNKHT